MAGYILVRVAVHDPQAYSRYTAAVPEVLARYDGRFLVRGGAAEAFEGRYDGERLVVLEFPSLERAHAFWHSEEYGALKALRQGAATMTAVAVEGV